MLDPEGLDAQAHLPVAGADKSRKVVLSSQVVLHGSRDPGTAERLELDATIQFESLDGFHEPKVALLHEVIDVDVVRQPRSHAIRDPLDMGAHVVDDQPLTQIGFRSSLVRLPRLHDVWIGISGVAIGRIPDGAG